MGILDLDGNSYLAARFVAYITPDMKLDAVNSDLDWSNCELPQNPRLPWLLIVQREECRAIVQ
jgi:hypothetical protein